MTEPTEPTEPIEPSEPSERRLSVALVLTVTAGLLTFFLWRYPVSGFAYPLGPDAPVYLWWSRLAAFEGLSSVARPGMPALTLVLAEVLGRSPAEVLGGIGAVLGTLTGLAGATLTSRTFENSNEASDAVEGHRRATFALGGALTGAFAAHLAGGYFANLAFAALFLAMAACLAVRTRIGTVAAALLFAAAGFAHPMFLVVGGSILLATAWFSRHRRHAFFASDLGHITGAALGGAAVFGAGMLAMLGGPSHVTAATSMDGLLRDAGLTSSLKSAYLDRLSRHWLRYLLPISLPLAAIGAWKDSGTFRGRLLRGWLVVLVGGVLLGILTGWFPAERILTFAYVLPLGATVGLLWLWQRLVARGQRPLAWITTGLLALLMIGGGTFTWLEQHPFIDEQNALQATRIAAASGELDPATTIVVVTDAPGQGAGFAAAKLANIVRSAMPAEDIRRVEVVIGQGGRVTNFSATNTDGARPTVTGDATHDALSRHTWEQVQAVIGDGPAIFIAGTPEGGAIQPDDPLAPHSPWDFVLTAILTLLVLTAIGLGWSLATLRRHASSLALAPTFGLAAVIVVGIFLERLGAPLDSWGAWVTCVISAVGGYLTWRIRERRATA